MKNLIFTVDSKDEEEVCRIIRNLPNSIKNKNAYEYNGFDYTFSNYYGIVENSCTGFGSLSYWNERLGYFDIVTNIDEFREYIKKSNLQCDELDNFIDIEALLPLDYDIY